MKTQRGSNGRSTYLEGGHLKGEVRLKRGAQALQFLSNIFRTLGILVIRHAVVLH
jgi:hypothetical protein